MHNLCSAQYICAVHILCTAQIRCYIYEVRVRFPLWTQNGVIWRVIRPLPWIHLAKQKCLLRLSHTLLLREPAFPQPLLLTRQLTLLRDWKIVGLCSSQHHRRGVSAVVGCFHAFKHHPLHKASKELMTFETVGSWKTISYQHHSVPTFCAQTQRSHSSSTMVVHLILMSFALSFPGLDSIWSPSQQAQIGLTTR